MIERVIFPFRGAEIGGSHLAAFTLADALRRRHGIDCLVICPADTAIMKEAQRLGLRTVASGETATGRNNFLTDVSRLMRRREILNGQRTDGCILHCSDINSLRAWGPAARLAGMGVVYHHHALNRLWWPPHLVGIAAAHAVICVSDATARGMNWVRPDAVKEFNPFDIDPAMNHAEPRRALLREFGWPERATIVGWVGNFWERKRPIFFLDVAAELARRSPQFRFALFGRGGDYTVEDVREAAADRGLADRTALPGFRLPEAANIAGLDVLLAPALREPFGRTLVEAIILGTPLVATRGSGHSEIIGEWGGGELVAENATPADVANKVCEAMASKRCLPPERRQKIATELSPEAHAERVLRIYQEMLHGRDRNPVGANASVS